MTAATDARLAAERSAATQDRPPIGRLEMACIEYRADGRPYPVYTPTCGCPLCRAAEKRSAS